MLSPIIIDDNEEINESEENTREENINLQNIENISDLFDAIDDDSVFEVFHISMANSQFNFDIL